MRYASYIWDKITMANYQTVMTMPSSDSFRKNKSSPLIHLSLSNTWQIANCGHMATLNHLLCVLTICQCNRSSSDECYFQDDVWGIIIKSFSCLLLPVAQAFSTNSLVATYQPCLADVSLPGYLPLETIQDTNLLGPRHSACSAAAEKPSTAS